MSQTEQKPSNLSSSFDHIPDIDADEQSKERSEIGTSVILMGKSIIFLDVVDDETVNNISNGMGSKSMDSINSYDGSRNALDDQDQGDDVEKARLISSVLELQNTLDDLNQRGSFISGFILYLSDAFFTVDGVKEENLRLKSENMVLGQYIGW